MGKTGYFTATPIAGNTTWARAIPSAPSGSTRSTTACSPPASPTRWNAREVPLATRRQTRRCAHSSAHVSPSSRERAAARCAAGGRPRALDPDTSPAAGTWAAALRAAGAAVAATDAVIAGELENAFCAVRPPGHHACRDQAMGFCFFNNVAVAARHALDAHGLKRVAIVDFDVHHGNGTEDILADDERVLMVSFFQHPFYPYSGAEPPATNMVNLPVPAYTRGMAGARADRGDAGCRGWRPSSRR